jgi:hypothetical protein
MFSCECSVSSINERRKLTRTLLLFINLTHFLF